MITTFAIKPMTKNFHFFKIVSTRALIVLSLSILIIGCGAPTNNATAPPIVGELVDGTPFALADLKGEYVLLHFWGSWCGPCLRENPRLVELHKEYGDRVTFVSVALEKDDRMWKKVVEKHGISWKHQIVDKAPMVMASKNARAYGVSDIPATFLIDREGNLVSQFHLPQISEVLNAMLDEAN
ncbi:MAG: thiol-disulfide isomerase/thioredoxin [Granulosicoccus sp.]|jgi:thiol-disulfide isomerase/thioredoxin